MNRKFLRIMINSIPILLIWLATYSLYIWIVKLYEPSIESLQIVSKTVTGRFVYEARGAGAQSYTRIDNTSLVCTVDAFGGTGLCEPGYDSYIVTAEMSKVDYWYGSYFVVIKISGLNLKTFVQSPQLILDKWRKFSHLDAFAKSIYWTVFLSIFYIYFVFGKEAFEFDK